MKKRILFAVLGLVIVIGALAAVKALQIRAMIEQGKEAVLPPETVTTAVAGFDLAAAQYRETVLQGFRDVADVLRALEFDAVTLKAQAEAEVAARDTLDIAKKQVRFGATSYLSLLNAQRQYFLSRILLVRVQAVRFSDTAALFQALGGGWWNRGPEPGMTRTSVMTDNPSAGALRP